MLVACAVVLRYRTCLHVYRTHPNTRATISPSAKASKSSHGRTDNRCLAFPFVPSVQKQRVSAHIPSALLLRHLDSRMISGLHFAPSTTLYYADPAHASTRFWNLRNNTALGCRRLSTEMSRGSCHACRDRAYPCKYALAGCQLHVRSKDSSSKKRQYSCLSDESSNGCMYDPSKIRRCSAPFCPELSAADLGPFCVSCEAGRTPCPELCGRSSVPGNSGYCSLCQRLSTSSSSMIRNAGIVSSSMTTVHSHTCSTEGCTFPLFMDSSCMHCVGYCVCGVGVVIYQITCAKSGKQVLKSSADAAERAQMMKRVTTRCLCLHYR